MTVLEDEVMPVRVLSKDKYSKNLLKRKNSANKDLPAKRKYIDLKDNMLNGFRSDQRNSGDNIQEAPVASLSNMGNTCYLNSVLYTLRFAPTFLHNLHHLIGDLNMVQNRLSQNRAKTSSLGRNIGAISGPNPRSASSSTSSKDFFTISSDIPKSKVQMVTERLHELFITMHNLELKESSDPYQPVALLQAVREANVIFEGNHQQDAHELLLYLLDNIRETCDFLSVQLQHNPDLLSEPETASSSNSGKIWGVRRSWKKGQSKKDKSVKGSINEDVINESVATDDDVDAGVSNDVQQKKIGFNFLTEDFEGITLVRTKCLECESVTERKEPFYDIPVPIISEGDFDITKIEGVSPSEIYRKACVTSEKLCDSNKYLCDKCKRYNEASRDVLFERLPNMMILQLKRFNTSTSGVHKVNTYLPTPLELDCFCESCCKLDEEELPPHYYKLSCIIMHLGGTMASGHYIAYVKASNYYNSYHECSRDMPKTGLSASCSEKSLNILKFLKPRAVANSLMEAKNGISSKSILNGLKICKSIDCCSVKLNKNVLENALNSQFKRNDHEEDMWLECDDESIRFLKSEELTQVLSYKPNSTATPYLLFYTKMKRNSATD
ncbi:ubiquitin carboxyl-terminal hydrolase 1 [Coccinella septempunctata]|uniref:ubiquitin carboxyl-terminal hydrolase 1 n=1 Tax=Coccinella septempunctata TaxID=41139 RepID=UPI001D082717|nr:ubiquitin carboxyl-terminal hydrolase 1 [Coccinella septempunctata]